jgi:fused signal recognition particle receptor
VLFVGVKVDEALFEELETALLMADAGVEATEYLLGELRRRIKNDRIETAEGVKAALKDLLTQLLKPLEKTMELGREQPLVMMIAGVNGAGKTTSIGKLCKHFQSYHQSVLLAAGDTFRAAAREQLTIWGERNNVTVVAQESGDPAAVIFDAVNAARAQDRHRDGRYRRPPAHAASPDGGTQEGQARDRQGDADRTARSAARDRRQHRPERTGPDARSMTRSA